MNARHDRWRQAVERVMTGRNGSSGESGPESRGEPDPEARRAEEHVTTMLSALVRAADLERLFDVNDEAVHRIAAATGPAEKAAGSFLETVRRLVAVLIEDSSDERALAHGFRGSASGRRLRFEAEGEAVRLDVRVHRRAVAGLIEGEYVVLGQWEGEGGGEARVKLATGASVSTPIDSEGFFSVKVPAGRVGIEMERRGRVLHLPEFEVGSEGR